MSTSLIITTYNWPRALECLLASVARQTRRPDEIIIADDGSDDTTRVVIDRFSKAFDRPVHHVWHEDRGFRRSRILNQAIVRASSDLVIQIDGDIILHPAFVDDHVRLARPGWFLHGYRIRLTQTQSDRVLASGSIDFWALADGRTVYKRIRIPWLAGRWAGNRSMRSARGHNVAYWHADALAINGYNEAIEGYGSEDTEFAVRLTNLGLKDRKVRHACIQNHLWHPETLGDRHAHNRAIAEQTTKHRLIRCAKGIVTESDSGRSPLTT